MRNKKQSAHRKFTISPRLRYGAISTAIVALVIVALILINLATTNLETRYGWRGDFSFNAVTTQSETTKQILRDFYPPFEQTLKLAEQQIEKVEVKDEPSDVPCDKCGAMMVYKMGRFGKFLACPNFPECRNTKPIVTYIDAPCPKCGARLMEKTSRKNRKFYGCERYPDCDFMTWDTPVPTKCEKCGSTLFRKGSKLYCAKEGCGFEMPVPKKD